MTELDIYQAALRPRRRFTPAFIAFIVGAVVAWLGWCCVCIVHDLAVTAQARACAAVEMSFDGTTCSNPPIEVHLHEHSGATEAPKKNPLLGPGGA